jgi:repressor LexA
MTQFGMTPMQAKCLQVIRTGIQQDGVPPTYERIGAVLGLVGKSGVARLVNGLVERGYVKKMHGRNRSLSIVPGKASPLVNFSTAELRAEIARREMESAQ